jgi:hypothetical protein
MVWGYFSWVKARNVLRPGRIRNLRKCISFICLAFGRFVYGGEIFCGLPGSLSGVRFTTEAGLFSLSSLRFTSWL